MNIYQVVRRRLAPYPFVKQFIKFSIVGTTSAIIHFVLLYLATEFFGWWYIYSNALGFFISATVNFVSNKLWTFSNRSAGLEIPRQVVKFSLVLGTGLVITTCIIFGLTEWLGLDYRLSWFGATVVVAAWNFSFNRFWTFRVHHNSLH